MRKILNIFVLLLFIIILNNCSSLSLPSFIKYFNYSKTGADVLSYSTTEKTTSGFWYPAHNSGSPGNSGPFPLTGGKAG